MVEIAVSGMPETAGVGEELTAVVAVTGLGREKNYSLQARTAEQTLSEQRIRTDKNGQWSGEMLVRGLTNEGVNIVTIRAMESETKYWDSQVTAIDVQGRVLGQQIAVEPTKPYDNPAPSAVTMGGVLLGIVIAIAVIMAIYGVKKSTGRAGAK